MKTFSKYWFTVKKNSFIRKFKHKWDIFLFTYRWIFHISGESKIVYRMDCAQRGSRSPNTSKLAIRNTLHATGIPPHRNTIHKLNKHFSKFGKIVSINAVYNGDPQAALISFGSHVDATLALNGLKNDSLIKIDWHQQKKIRFPCDHCGRTMATKQILQRHKERMHPANICPICNARFETRSHYEKHYNVCHLNINPSNGLGNQSVQSSSMSVDDSMGKYKEMQVENAELKKKLKKNKKKMNEAEETQKSMNEIIKG